jgi:outer membrane protein
MTYRRWNPRMGPLGQGVLACVLVCASASFAGAQALPPQLPGRPLTLEDILDIAESRSEAIAVARAGQTRAEADRIRARSGLLPQLSASASYERALASEFEGIFDAGGATCPPFVPVPGASIEERVAELERAVDCGATGTGLFGGGPGDGEGSGFEDLPFGRENTWRLSLAFSQNLWSGGRIGAELAVAAAGRESANLSLTTARGQLLFEATQAYYDAALSDRLLQIAEATYQQADATLRQVQAGFDAGTQPEFEVLRARVGRDTQQPDVIRQRINREVALLRLKQLLDLPATFNLQIADPLGDQLLPPAPVFATRVAAVEKVMQSDDMTALVAQGLSASLPQRAAVDAAAAALRRSEAALDLAAAQRRPSASITSSYSRITYPSGLFSGFESWRTNWTIGASVQMPILTGGRQRGDELAARAGVQESTARLQQTRELASLDTRLAWAELLAARATWEASAGTVEQATRAHEIANVRYEAGVSTQLELSDARLLLQQAEVNRARAARDLQVARARVALLPELPLTAAAPATGAQQPAVTVPQTPQPQQPFGTGGVQSASAQGSQIQAGR